jgi:hypothetical protein
VLGVHARTLWSFRRFAFDLVRVLRRLAFADHFFRFFMFLLRLAGLPAVVFVL